MPSNQVSPAVKEEVKNLFIQFLEQKTKTQEEFFKLFELLYTEKKKMVVTSDRPANQLQNFMDRLKSRLSYGLAVDIKKPDKQLRLGILQKKLPTHITIHIIF